jgi:hypothetical protein
MWILGQANWELLVSDDLYGIEYLLTKFFQWRERQVRGDPLPGAPQPPAEIAPALARARVILMAALKDIEALELLNRERGD